MGKRTCIILSIEESHIALLLKKRLTRCFGISEKFRNVWLTKCLVSIGIKVLIEVRHGGHGAPIMFLP
jgi:hypothetical protein